MKIYKYTHKIYMV